MADRGSWKQRQRLRSIEQQARRTADPLERLRYVRNQMDSCEPLEEFRWGPLAKIAAVIAAAIGTALLVWRIH
jgi:hypothetical protein